MTDDNENYGDDWERRFYEKCEPQRDPDSGVYEAEIARLALLAPDLEYQFERKPAAKRLGVSVSSLDRMVKARRPKKSGEDEICAGH